MIEQALLTGGNTGRLYKKLVEGKEVAGERRRAATTPAATPAGFRIQVEVLKGKDRKKAEKSVLEELKKLADEPPSRPN